MEARDSEASYTQVHDFSGLQQPLSTNEEKPLPLGTAVKELFLDTIPTFAFYLSNVLIWAFNYYYAGQLGDADLTSAIGLASTWLGATSFFVILGLNVGTTASCSQSMGAKQYRIVGITFHRALITRFIIAFGTYPVVFFSEHVFKLFGVEDSVAEEAGLFCQCQIIVIIFTVLYDTFKSFLMAHNIYTPFIYIQTISVISHWFLLGYIMKIIECKVVAFSVAMSITYILLFALLILYIIVKNPCQETLFFFKKDSFRGLFKQFKEEAPIGAILYLDFAAFEFATLIAGSYSSVQLAAQILNYNVMGVMVLLPLGLNATLTTYVGNAIGEGHIHKTQQYMKAGYILTAIFVIIEAPALFFLNEPFAELYSTDHEVIDATKNAERIYAASIIADFTTLVMTSILRGIGKEHTACIIFATGYYLIGLPLAFVFGTLREGYTSGIWLGLAIGYSFNAIATTIAVIRVSLSHQAQRISLRISQKMRISMPSFASMHSSDGAGAKGGKSSLVMSEHETETQVSPVTLNDES